MGFYGTIWDYMGLYGLYGFVWMWVGVWAWAVGPRLMSEPGCSKWHAAVDWCWWRYIYIYVHIRPRTLKGFLPSPIHFDFHLTLFCPFGGWQLWTRWLLSLSFLLFEHRQSGSLAALHSFLIAELSTLWCSRSISPLYSRKIWTICSITQNIKLRTKEVDIPQVDKSWAGTWVAQSC